MEKKIRGKTQYFSRRLWLTITGAYLSCKPLLSGAWHEQLQKLESQQSEPCPSGQGQLSQGAVVVALLIPDINNSLLSCEEALAKPAAGKAR